MQTIDYLMNEKKTMEMVDNELNSLIDYTGDRNEINKEDITKIKIAIKATTINRLFKKLIDSIGSFLYDEAINEAINDANKKSD